MSSGAIVIEGGSAVQTAEAPSRADLWSRACRGRTRRTCERRMHCQSWGGVLGDGPERSTRHTRCTAASPAPAPPMDEGERAPAKAKRKQ